MNMDEVQCTMAEYCLSEKKKASKVGIGLFWCKRCYQRLKIGFIERKSKNKSNLPDELILSLIQTSSNNQKIADSQKLRIIYAKVFSTDLSVADTSIFLSMMTKQVSPKASSQQRLSFMLAAYFCWKYGKVQTGEKISQRRILALIRLANNVFQDLLLTFGWTKGVFARKLSEDGSDYEYRLLEKKKGKKWSKKAFREIFETVMPQFPQENSLVKEILKQKM